MGHRSPSTVFPIAEKQILATSYLEMVFTQVIRKFVWLQFMRVSLKMALEVMLLLLNKDWSRKILFSLRQGYRIELGLMYMESSYIYGS